MGKIFLAAAVIMVIMFATHEKKVSYASEHFRDGTFHNLVETPNKSSGSKLGSIYRILFESGKYSPKELIKAHKINPLYANMNTGDTLQATWLGHASVMLKQGDMKIITDPVFSKRVSPLSFIGPERYTDDNPIRGVNIGFVDAVIISHNHYDHLDERAIKSLKDRVGMFIVPLGVGQYLEKWGVDPLRIIELDWYQSLSMPNMKITATPALHRSGRSYFDTNKTFWASYVIEMGGHKVFFSGDSGYMEQFRQIGHEYGPFELSLVDIGAYNAKWPFSHMTPEEAVQASKDLGSGTVLPIHWGTFTLSDFYWKEPIERFTAEAHKRNLNYVTPEIGLPFTVGGIAPVEKWWDRYE
ncbi:MBL fold metallo-hydrolase [Seleniivibrio sp.]|uniref:MBL fold metallo-hydrolase n=1 Tax=Seleniivibrio sp. TaxID=2898801 RepID=UPI0025DF116B|nr:MBL fold metallo-hydrolase [Seleniivibrio sp.]MCD8554638.1 MBL fold metallo-hydrolase [Seleniivibrio sp.]